MLHKSGNCYLNARMWAGLTRLQAAMRLCSSETSLREYESGARPVPDDMVLAMAREYRTPWLRIQHLSGNAVFRDVFAGRLDVEAGKEEQATGVLRLQKEVSDVMGQMPNIIEKSLTGTDMSADVVKDLKEAGIAILNLLGLRKSETACAGTQTASVVK